MAGASLRNQQRIIANQQTIVRNQGKILRDLVAERPSPRRRQVVVPRNAIVLGGAPVGGHPPALLVSMEGGIERPLPDPEALPRQLLHPVGNPPPMHRRQGKRLENQQVQRALHDGGGGGGGGHDQN